MAEWTVIICHSISQAPYHIYNQEYFKVLCECLQHNYDMILHTSYWTPLSLPHTSVQVLQYFWTVFSSLILLFGDVSLQGNSSSHHFFYKIATNISKPSFLTEWQSFLSTAGIPIRRLVRLGAWSFRLCFPWTGYPESKDVQKNILVALSVTLITMNDPKKLWYGTQTLALLSLSSSFPKVTEEHTSQFIPLVRSSKCSLNGFKGYIVKN